MNRRQKKKHQSKYKNKSYKKVNILKNLLKYYKSKEFNLVMAQYLEDQRTYGIGRLLITSDNIHHNIPIMFPYK